MCWCVNCGRKIPWWIGIFLCWFGQIARSVRWYMAYIRSGIQDLAECPLLFHLLVDLLIIPASGCRQRKRNQEEQMESDGEPEGRRLAAKWRSVVQRCYTDRSLVGNVATWQEKFTVTQTLTGSSFKQTTTRFHPQPLPPSKHFTRRLYGYQTVVSLTDLQLEMLQPGRRRAQ